jgi:hypothetical protein
LLLDYLKVYIDMIETTWQEADEMFKEHSEINPNMSVVDALRDPEVQRNRKRYLALDDKLRRMFKSHSLGTIPLADRKPSVFDLLRSCE